jgi:biopolymer transport protein ExbB
MLNFDLFIAGGIVMIPLAILFFITIIISCDKILFVLINTKTCENLTNIINKNNICWKNFEDELSKISIKNCYRVFLQIFIDKKGQPLWIIESTAINQAKKFEKEFSNNFWILETTITSAPLLGLLGTIFGMSSSFKIIGDTSALNVNGITAGVAESLIASAFGLIIALIALAVFNYFNKVQNNILDEMEMLGDKILKNLRLQHENTSK